jgi:hypothetical protein
VASKKKGRKGGASFGEISGEDGGRVHRPKRRQPHIVMEIREMHGETDSLIRNLTPWAQRSVLGTHIAPKDYEGALPQ